MASLSHYLPFPPASLFNDSGFRRKLHAYTGGGGSVKAITFADPILAPYTVLKTDEVVLCSTGINEGPVEVILPSDAVVGQEFTIKRTDPTYDITVSVAGGAKIDVQTEYILPASTQLLSVTFLFDGANYWIIAYFPS